MLGGLFTGIIAPNIFSSITEYPLMVFAALLARPGTFAIGKLRAWREALIMAGIFAVIAGPKLVLGFEPVEDAPVLYIAFFAAMGGAIIIARNDAVRLAVLVGAVLLTGSVLRPDFSTGQSMRGFFGVNSIRETVDGKYRLLANGTTLHGAMQIDAEAKKWKKPEPLLYYHSQGSFQTAMNALRKERAFKRVGVVGLGAGSLACTRAKGETWRYFEIDPIVVKIASDPTKFRFLSDCTPDAKIVLGDARLTLARDDLGAYDVLVLDAFSSDAVPVHLLTVEAMRSYLTKLAEGGVILFHISNRHMDLAPVLSAAARELGLASMISYGKTRASDVIRAYKASAKVVALARTPKALAPLKNVDGWQSLAPTGQRAWSDDYSNVLGAILAQWRKQRAAVKESKPAGTTK